MSERLARCIGSPGCDGRSHGIDCNNVFYTPVETELCECKQIRDSFACKIRHQGQPIIRWGKASKE